MNEDGAAPPRWYDGFIYDKLASPMQRRLNEDIAALVGPAGSVVDLCCGAGILAFLLAGRCGRVLGVDASSGMIDFARSKGARLGPGSPEFVRMRGEDLAEATEERFDRAVLSLCLHEMDEPVRVAVAAGSARLAGGIVIADYLARFPRGATGAAQIGLEFLAGRRHYRNFCDWQARGGIEGFMERMGFRLVERLDWGDGIGTTVLVAARR